MDGVFHIDKSLQERLTLYEEVFPPNFSSIKQQWSWYLQDNVDTNGWQAVWKIPRATCESLNIPFPSIALVIVLDVKVNQLEAVVKVLGVEDEDIHIPERHRVPLVQLWVTKTQDKSIGFLSINSTAHTIDALRFFYLHLYMPWDNDEIENYEWKEKHLESRLRLYYDMRNGIIPRSTSETIRSLISEAKRLYTKREFLEESISDIQHEDDLFLNKNTEKLMQIQVRMLEIKSAIEVYEDPLLRKVLIKRQNQESPMTISEKQFWLVFEQGEVEDYLKFLEKVKEDFGNTKTMSFVSNLAQVLEIANANSTFILKDSIHVIHSTGALENGGELIGVVDKSKTTIMSDIDDVMFDFVDNVKIKNLTINAGNAKCAILVRKGKVTLENVQIIGNGKSSTAQGIIVLPGAYVELKNCDISKFSCAITGNPSSEIIITNSEIHDVHYGLKILEGCSVNVQDATIRNCKHYGVVLETQKGISKNVGDFELLRM